MKYFLPILFFLLLNCSSTEPIDDDNQPTNLYFPPNSGTWETMTPQSQGWNLNKLNALKTFLSNNGTRGFIILKDGKIVVEEYWGNNLLNTAPFTQNTRWYWASAGKTITAFLVGKAQEENFLSIEDKSSDYLSNGWTSMTLAQEHQIKIKHQLTMITGLDYEVNLDCLSPECLTYKANPGTQWYYHNAPYTLLKNVVENATSKTYQAYTQEKLHQTIGMEGLWIFNNDINLYYSTTRSAARFGLMMLAQGSWNGNKVMNDMQYFNQMINTSQNLNLSYGYLWWLNGKSSVVYPGTTISLPTWISPAAPNDLYIAMGKNGQFVGVVPSKNLVYVRFGEAPDNAAVPVTFHNQMWELMNAMME